MRIRRLRRATSWTLLGVMLAIVIVVLVTGISDIGNRRAWGQSDVYAAAQNEEPVLRLRLRRDLGYGSGAQIRGRFSLIVDEVDDLQRVEFFIDEEVIGEDSEAPFRLQFETGGYELGWHTLRAVGYTADGRALASNVFQRQFVTGSASTYIVIGIVALVLGLRLVSYLVTRNKETEPKWSYGMYGGAVCPRCGWPFSRHWWAPNLLVGKLDRCPHCGKWHFSTRATPQMLASAQRFAEEMEAEEQEAIEQPDEPDEEELLRRRLDESRFE